MAEGEASQKNADERIDDREENDMSRHGHEVADAFRHRILQVRKADPADDRLGRALTRAGDQMEIGHSPASLNRSSNGREARVTQSTSGAGHAIAATCHAESLAQWPGIVFTCR